MPDQNALSLRFLGEIELRRGRRRLPLPPSKKTRALLAHLALSPRPIRRERLCALLWDVTDDPRGALRWSLSKLRSLVDDASATRLLADRDTIAFDASDARIDVVAMRTALARGTNHLPTPTLAALAQEFRGEFLEGLELPGFLEFQAWCVGQREEMRQLQGAVLRTLVVRCGDRAADALPHARALVQCDPLDEEARALLVRLLLADHRPREAEEHYRSAKRVLLELGRPLAGALEQAWATATTADANPLDVAATILPPDGATAPLVGREVEVTRLRELLTDVTTTRRERVVLLSGEPGVGKTRLLAELMTAARAAGGTVLDGCSYEVEVARPYGPWVDALRKLPVTSVGPTLGSELAPLLPELGSAPDASTRERLFGGVVELLAARAHSAPPVVVVLDDVQWCDEASTTLLHYVARMHRHRPLLLALAARAGELLDNAAMARAVRALRREGVLVELRIGPLDAPDTATLVRSVAPGADAARVYAESGGNPLFALEAARAPDRSGDVPATLGELVRDRLERLPPEAAHVLRWAAVLGRTFDVDRLSTLAVLDTETLVQALEVLERHALLRVAHQPRQSAGAYTFAHDVVRTVVYGDLSAPRRCLMHQRVAHVLDALPHPDEGVAAEIVHHAALAGDGALAARSCVAAARRCLRVFANHEAEALARRGMLHAEQVPATDRVRLLLELHHVALAARRPDRLDDAAREIEALAKSAAADGAIEHARLGFHMVSWLRWEHGDWSDARRSTLAAEQISRAGDATERLVAMAEAARCLAILERDLPHAESLLLEASATARRLGIDSLAIEDGLGVLRMHQGEVEAAQTHFEQARTLARRDGDHDGEFQALAHLVALEIDAERWREAALLAADLVALAAKLRGGSEGPYAAALSALCDGAQAVGGAPAALEAALVDLRVADSKHRLAFVLTRAGELDLQRGDADAAEARAREAAEAAARLESPSECALARVLLTRAVAARDGTNPVVADLADVGGATMLSARARRAIDDLRAGRSTPRRRGGRRGTRDRRTSAG
ncbi:MAG TPA: AAA family ATPase [Candidatus Binatia bacterium]|jgi:DNA-binding SARP family transcriptional activator/predicted ATPase|nr:AAA family ATPase [Candidatus Binatia bacterium]